MANLAHGEGVSAVAPVTTVTCTGDHRDAQVLEGVLGALDSCEFVFARSMALADGFGCRGTCSLYFFSQFSIWSWSFELMKSETCIVTLVSTLSLC